jgi:dephospho-CoA kinase
LIWIAGRKGDEILLKVGLTGGIACGKSTVAQMLAHKGALLIDADQIARETVKPGEPAWEEIVAWLGRDILTPDGNLDRRKIANLVFNNKHDLQKLNKIVHPRVMELFYVRSRELEKRYPQKIQIWDIPLLFEAGEQDSVDFIVVVASRAENQIKRLMERDGLSREEALNRINSQQDLQAKISAADFVIYNDDTKEFLKNQVDLLWEKLRVICN